MTRVMLPWSHMFVLTAVLCLSLLDSVTSFSGINQLRTPLLFDASRRFHTNKLYSTTPLLEQSTQSSRAEIDPLALLKGLGSVSSMMRTDFPRVYDTDSVSIAVEAMRVANKGSVLVFDENDNLSGIFTERDFVFKVMGGSSMEKDTIMGTVMTPRNKLIVANAETSINECAQLMTANKIRHLPILNYRGDAVGIISMRDIIRIIHEEDMAVVSPVFYGSTLLEVEEQAKFLANKLSLEGGEEGGKQDISRAAFVVAASIVSAGILQGDWIHDHEWLSMSLVFLLGYVGIVFENLFEFNKAAIALLMATALWSIFAGR